ncbi:hypothetical protein ZIOFF_000762 [Zingiber officinale]|uniref:Trichome birefringence-like N-terminal domain-containing protein n=1 Tax=Zingiber officinale TaxID=94328 RepID=A0A8J5LRL7_ZINOF|nr:hypothetical protein ZIOFF_000762 [Zingiber officinale]
MMARRKLSFLAANKIDLKHSSSFGGGRRKSCKYSVFVVISLALLLFTFMYNGDVKSIGEHPFGSRDYSQIEFPIRYDIGHQQSKQAVEEKESTKLIEKAEEKAAAEKDRAVVVDVANSSAKKEEKREVREVKAPKEEEFHDVKIPAMDVEERKEDLREVKEAPTLEEEGRKEVLREEKEPIMDKEERKGNSREAKAPATEVKEAVKKAERQRIILDVPENCDLFDGKWVYDDENYPIYKEAGCQFLTEQVTCMRNGRRNDRFQKWRWQPKDCALPRFDAEVMLERLRGKRLMFVGDSLSRNQWESMVCLVQSVVPSNRKSLTKHGSFSVLRLEEYDATVEFYWAPFLVESNSDDPKIHSLPDRIIMPKSIDRHGKYWKNVDYLVFNTYIWWMNTPTVKVLRGSFNESSTEYDEVERPLAYRRVLNTWAKWVQSNVNPNRTMEHGLGQSDGDQVRAGDGTGGELVRMAADRGGDGLAAVFSGGERDREAAEEGAGDVREDNSDVGVAQGRAHVGSHAAAGEAADGGATGGPGSLRRLRTLVPAWLAGHLERVSLHPHRVKPLERPLVLLCFVSFRAISLYDSNL